MWWSARAVRRGFIDLFFHPYPGRFVLLPALLWSLLPATAAAQLRIVHIDVGQGDATLIIGPTATLLFDAGPTGTGTHIRNVLSAEGVSALDYFVAGHYHEDHIGGIDEVVKAGIPVTGAAYDRGGRYSSTAFSEYVKAVGARRQTLQLNQEIDLGGGCTLRCIGINGRTNHGYARPTGENDRSIALVLRYGTFDYFIASDLTGGGVTDGVATADVESLVAPDAGDVDVLHVGHHGSNTSTNQTLIDTLEPEQAVISCGDGNSYGHPTQEVLNRLTAAPAMDTVWQTERGDGGSSPKVRVGGDIALSTDGDSYSIHISATNQTFSYMTDGVAGGGAGTDAVVINEVAWMGSESDAYDEWLELYNNSGAGVDLAGWQIVDDGGAQVYPLEGMIDPWGYFLIEREGNATSVLEDLEMPAMSLANSGDSLELQDSSGATVDVVNPLGVSWPAGTTSGHYTMERIDPGVSGDTASNWTQNDGVTRDGLDSGGKPINGTPGALNSVGG